MNHYELLGISENSNESEIKKAYFKKIRQYPPDKAPDEFKKIKDAYDTLQNPVLRKKQDALDDLPPLFRTMYENADKNKGYESNKGVAICKEAIKRGAPKELFLSLLGNIYLNNYENGKAVKVYEELIALCPEDVSYKIKLAEAYNERGFTKKALVLFQELYENNNHNPHFLYKYLESSKLTKKEKTEAAHKLIEQCPNLTSENLIYVFDTMELLVELNYSSSPAALKKEYNFIKEYIHNNKQKLHMFQEDVVDLLQLFDTNYTLNLHNTGCVPQILDEIKSTSVMESKLVKGMVDYLELRVESECARQDPRLSELIDDAYELYLHSRQREWMFSKISGDYTSTMNSLFHGKMEEEYLDLKFSILLEMPGIKKELDVLKIEYPKLMEELQEFLDEIENTNSLSYLTSKIEKKLTSKLGYSNGSHLKRAKDGEQGGLDKSKFVYESDSYSEPYRREEKKTGRNDPCPCGSGKKYKQCCGKN